MKSTRSAESADATRDFDDFDVNEELCRARRALREIDRGEFVERSPDALRAFAAECFANIDEWLSRGGDLPSAWQGRFPFAGATASNQTTATLRNIWARAMAATVVDIQSTTVVKSSGTPCLSPNLPMPDANAASALTNVSEERSST